jgi:hypothetical protein
MFQSKNSVTHIEMPSKLILLDIHFVRDNKISNEPTEIKTVYVNKSVREHIRLKY